MTDFVEVHNKATGRNEIIPEDWLDSPILNHDVNGDPLERVVHVPVGQPEQRPTANSTHAEIDAFAAAHDVVFADDTKTREQKIAVLDELAPAAEQPDAEPSGPQPEPGVALTGPVSSESVIPALQNPNQADDEEN